MTGGLKMTFLMRLTPLIPYILLNYLLALTKISMKDFCLGTFGLLPSQFVFVMAGTTISNIQDAAGGDYTGGTGTFVFMAVMTVLGCGGVVYISITVGKYMKLALQEEQSNSIVYSESPNEDTENLTSDADNSAA